MSDQTGVDIHTIQCSGIVCRERNDQVRTLQHTCGSDLLDLIVVVTERVDLIYLIQSTPGFSFHAHKTIAGLPAPVHRRIFGCEWMGHGVGSRIEVIRRLFHPYAESDRLKCTDGKRPQRFVKGNIGIHQEPCVGYRCGLTAVMHQFDLRYVELQAFSSKIVAQIILRRDA